MFQVYFLIISFFFVLNLVIFIIYYVNKGGLRYLIYAFFFFSLFFLFNILLLFYCQIYFLDFSVVVTIGLRLGGFKLKFFVDLYSIFFVSVAMVVSNSIFMFALVYSVGESFDFTFLLLLILFLIFMFLLVFSGNFIIMFFRWERVGILSFLLISWWFRRREARIRSYQAVFYNRIRDLRMVLAIVISLVYLDNDSVVYIDGHFSFLFLLVFVSIIAKSSQFFFHPWLPNAMERPTPVSSLLHSSTMVVARVYLMIRISPCISNFYLVFVIRTLTSLFRRICASFSFDFKKVVAYSTTSQLRFMLMSLRIRMYKFCLLYILFHAFFKALIFMLSGLLIHRSDRLQDMRKIQGVISSSSFSKFSLFISSITIIGFPFFCGFWVKDYIIDSLGFGFLRFFLFILSMVAVILTSVYSVRLISFLWLSNFISFLKFLRMESLFVLGFKFVLLLFSIISAFFIFFLNPGEHLFLIFTVKLVPLFLMFIGAFIRFCMFLQVNSFFLFYMFFWNPLVHKITVFISGLFIRLAKWFDYVFIEFVRPFRFVKFLTILFLFYRGFGLYYYFIFI